MKDRLKKLERKAGLKRSPLRVVLAHPGDDVDELVAQWSGGGRRSGLLIILNIAAPRDSLLHPDDSFPEDRVVH